MSTPADRLQLLYDLARGITTFTDLDPLLRYATRRARELLEAEGCAVLLLDLRRGILFFPVASQMASREAMSAMLEETTFPAHKGVAGWVLQHDRAALVEDAGRDPRFYAEVDRVTGATTQTILCAPLRTPGGNIGVVEVINPLRRPFDAADLAFLEAMAADIAVACEKARLYDRLRREAADLRRLCRTVGVGIAVLGLVFVVGATYTQLALALPVREVATRPAMLIGGLLGVTGVAIAAIAGRWPIAPRGETASSA